ncbi:MAG TPA: glycosyltransferase family 2 protein [Bacteroidales bacterium]|nr:glycosyltransferase family 2 protein [Bacteroidales bacterium]
MDKAAIVILNWNGLEYLKSFLGKVVIYSARQGISVCVADNGSTDGSAEWMAGHFSDVRLVTFDRNHGFAGGYNLALKDIKAQYYILLNSDIEVTQGWLDPLIDYMDKNPDVAACQPKILSYYQKDHFEYAGAAGGYIDRFGYTFCRGRIFEKTEEDKGQYESTTDIFWSSGACMLIRPEAWEKCGGFDSDFFAHMEEIDLCWRLNRAGYRVSYIHNATVYHVGGGALPYDSPFKTYLNFRNSLYLLYKNLPDKNFHLLIFARKILDGLAALRFLAKGKTECFRAVLNAHFDYYKASGALRKKREEIKKLGSPDYRSPLLNKSVVYEFYIKGNKTYNSIFKE